MKNRAGRGKEIVGTDGQKPSSRRIRLRKVKRGKKGKDN